MPKPHPSLFSKCSDLLDAGYYIGARDPKRNTSFHGKYMICIDRDVETTTDSSTGGYCVVGDDLEDLIIDAYIFYMNDI